MGALFSISAKDIPAFERYMAQLNLLWLLTQNRVAEFHTELELLSPKDIQNNVFIHYPVSLEQYLMEGCYNKVINPCLKCVLIEKRRLIFVLC